MAHDITDFKGLPVSNIIGAQTIPVTKNKESCSAVNWQSCDFTSIIFKFL